VNKKTRQKTEQEDYEQRDESGNNRRIVNKKTRQETGVYLLTSPYVQESKQDITSGLLDSEG
jgi:hypothetical protein